jgi:hypothetical protein
VNPDDFLTWHGEHAKRIVHPQVFFGREREMPQIFQGPEVIRVNTRQLTFATIAGDVLISMPKGPP